MEEQQQTITNTELCAILQGLNIVNNDNGYYKECMLNHVEIINLQEKIAKYFIKEEA